MGIRKLAGITDPESKRKIIGREFIAVFDDVVAKLVKEHSKESKTGSARAIDYLVQGNFVFAGLAHRHSGSIDGLH